MTSKQNNNHIRQFLTNISHEIRTPLNAISGMSQLLSDTKLDDEQQEFVGTIQKAGTHLISLLDNLLDVTRLQANEVVLAEDTLDIADELSVLILKFNELANAKDTSISVECTPDVAGNKTFDKKRFHQCLSNLLGNAVKFTESGKIAISCWVDQTSSDSGELYVSVTDSGPGIEADDLKNIFNSFQQINANAQHSFDGSGLGLTVTSQLAEIMGGNLEAVSTPGTGSTFTLCIAYKLPKANTDEIKQSSAHILIVEDNMTNQRLIQLVLQKLGYTCSLAPDGKQGVDLFHKEKFDLVLMDLHMPVMDGFAATTKIRQSGASNASLPIIALTADVRTGVEQRIYDAGMDAYLSKPFEIPVLATTISAMLEIAAEEQQQVKSA